MLFIDGTSVLYTLHRHTFLKYIMKTIIEMYICVFYMNSTFNKVCVLKSKKFQRLN